MRPTQLSFAQERFWFLDQFETNHSVYNSCKAERLLGELDPRGLEKSLLTIVQRHEVLRTAYPIIDGEPVQVVREAPLLPIPVIDYKDLPRSERWSSAIKNAEEESRQSFDLNAGAVMRVKLLRIDEQDHVLLVTLHQIVFDSWSVELFFRELWTLYASSSRNSIVGSCDASGRIGSNTGAAEAGNSFQSVSFTTNWDLCDLSS